MKISSTLFPAVTVNTSMPVSRLLVTPKWIVQLSQLMCGFLVMLFCHMLADTDSFSEDIGGNLYAFIAVVTGLLVCMTIIGFWQDVILPTINERGETIGRVFKTICSALLVIGGLVGWRAFGGFCEIANF